MTSGYRGGIGSVKEEEDGTNVRVEPQGATGERQDGTRGGA